MFSKVLGNVLEIKQWKGKASNLYRTSFRIHYENILWLYLDFETEHDIYLQNNLNTMVQSKSQHLSIFLIKIMILGIFVCLLFMWYIVFTKLYQIWFRLHLFALKVKTLRLRVPHCWQSYLNCSWELKIS